jgi:hypothetical protein
MAARVFVGIVGLVCVSVCGIVSTLVGNQIAEKVNEKLIEGRQFEVLGWRRSKRQQLHREYSRLYPEGAPSFQAPPACDISDFWFDRLRLERWILRVIVRALPSVPALHDEVHSALDHVSSGISTSV